MQVSLSETFNFVTADFVISGIPIVVSPEIDWMPSPFQANPTDDNDIMKAMSTALRGRLLHFHYSCQKALQKQNRLNVEWWESYLDYNVPH